MAGLLDGLGNLGLSNLSRLDVYEKEDNATIVNAEEEKAPEEEVIREEDCLFEKKYKCPVCGEEFPSLTVRANKVRRVDMDQDLRPLFEPIDSLKYDPVMCPYCGYADFPKTFSIVSDFQRNEIRNNIAKSYVPQLDFPDTYDYETAFKRYQMALATAIVTKAKTSVRAYICLKTAWILRGQIESLDPAMPNYNKKVENLREKESEFLKNALEGFLTARQKEPLPIADMDEITLDFLIGALSLKQGKLDVASKMVAKVLVSKSANKRVKDKARDMKEMILEAVRAKQG